jgi:hypothetical protein
LADAVFDKKAESLWKIFLLAEKMPIFEEKEIKERAEIQILLDKKLIKVIMPRKGKDYLGLEWPFSGLTLKQKTTLAVFGLNARSMRDIRKNLIPELKKLGIEHPLDEIRDLVEQGILFKKEKKQQLCFKFN